MAAEKNALPEWSDPDLTPDHFLYGRKGPWPQPSPDHPLKEAAEVLNVPLVEGIVWDLAVGVRLLRDEAFYPPQAAQLAVQDMDSPHSERCRLQRLYVGHALHTLHEAGVARRHQRLRHSPRCGEVVEVRLQRDETGQAD